MSERETLKQKIIEILDDIVINENEVEYKENTDLKADLGMDSLALIHLIMNLNSEFNIEIGSEEITIENFSTIGLLENFIAKKLEE